MIFARRLVEEIAGRSKVQFRLETISGAGPSAIMTLSGSSHASATAGTLYFVLIFNCQNDEKVKSAILDRYKNLERASYSMIIGIRDLYPRPLSEINVVKQNLRTRLPTKGIPIAIVLAVAEIEAWFIWEHTHFKRVDPGLDAAAIAATFGFDPRSDNVESIAHPSELLDNIYGTVGKAYKKKRNQVQRTVDNLDYASLYMQAPASVPHLKELLDLIDTFLGSQ